MSHRDMFRSNDESVKVVELPGPVRVENVKHLVVSVSVSTYSARQVSIKAITPSWAS
ncbi:unnamed protein product [Alternaria alternata]